MSTQLKKVYKCCKCGKYRISSTETKSCSTCEGTMELVGEARETCSNKEVCTAKILKKIK